MNTLRLILILVTLAFGARAAFTALAAVKPLAHSAEQIETTLKRMDK